MFFKDWEICSNFPFAFIGAIVCDFWIGKAKASNIKINENTIALNILSINFSLKSFNLFPMFMNFFVAHLSYKSKILYECSLC